MGQRFLYLRHADSYCRPQTTNKSQAPQKDSNLPAFLFFVVFICIVGFALMNLFSGVVFFQFTRIKLSRQTNDALLTDDQKHWKLIVYSIVRTKFPPRQVSVACNILSAEFRAACTVVALFPCGRWCGRAACGRGAW